MTIATFGPALTPEFSASLKQSQAAELHRHLVIQMAAIEAARERHTINCGSEVVGGDSVLFLIASPDRWLFRSRRRLPVRLEVITSRVAYVRLVDGRGNRFARLVDHPQSISNRLSEIVRFGCWRAPWPSAEGRDKALALLDARLDEELHRLDQANHAHSKAG